MCSDFHAADGVVGVDWTRRLAAGGWRTISSYWCCRKKRLLPVTKGVSENVCIKMVDVQGAADFYFNVVFASHYKWCRGILVSHWHWLQLSPLLHGELIKTTHTCTVILLVKEPFLFRFLSPLCMLPLTCGQLILNTQKLHLTLQHQPKGWQDV